MRTRITAKYVIGFENGDHVVYVDGEVVYENDTIIHVGHSFQGEVDQTINAGLSIVSPGFIDLNALGDIDHDLVHLEIPDQLRKSLLWSEEYFVAGSREFLTPEEEAFKSLFAYIQLIQHGVTTAMPITSVLYKRWAETYEEITAAADNAGRLGLRIYLGPSYQSGVDVVKKDGTFTVGWDEDQGEAGLERAIKFIENYDGAYNGLVKGMLAPERIETISEQLLKKSRQWSDKLKCPIRLHAAQGLNEYNYIQNRFGKTPIQYLHDIGFLGERVAIPHAIFLTGYSGIPDYEGDDITLLRDTKTTVIHCPVIISRHGHAIESFGRYLRSGVRLALGTDTFPPDIIQNIRLGSYVARIVDRSTTNNTFADLYRAATLGGATLLGRDDLGRLAPGAKADIIIIDLSEFHFGTLDDPIRTLMISGCGLDIKTSIINGQIVMRDRFIQGVDLDSIKSAAQAYYEKLRASYLERDYAHSRPEELFPSSFPLIERRTTS